MQLPDWNNVLANQLLVNLYDRQKHVELAKQDYAVYSQLAMASLNSKEFESRTEVISKIRGSYIQVLNGEVFNPIILRKRQDEALSQKRQNLDLLQKVAKL